MSARSFRVCRLPVGSLLATALGGVTLPAQTTVLNYRPTASEVILNTDHTVITPENGPPVHVSGGVFVFHDVTIPPGVSVRGVGSRPMVWIVSGDFVVDGTLRVDGTDGAPSVTLSAANFSVEGGRGGAGAGDGGDGSPNNEGHSARGGDGLAPRVPFGFDLIGGRGGLFADRACGRASGGGGGAFATVGDPHYAVKRTPMSSAFIQQIGVGGFGCLGPSGSPSRSLPGGAPGISVFRDGRADNDFFGVALNLFTGERIAGELPFPIGGQGGGGGGDLEGPAGAGFVADSTGGGGGGGGGALIVIARGSIVIGPLARFSADGGHGGGGSQAGGNTEGGGGGGGSGGMVLLAAGERIELHAHGETYANADYDFAISADGGAGSESSFGGGTEHAKYPPPASGELWDRNPFGGFGGMGLVQLMVRPGDNADGTNTALDDRIVVRRAGVELLGTEKERYLAWRGFPDPRGVWVGDDGRPTYNNDPSIAGYPAWATSPDDEGDIRPAPILLPLAGLDARF